MIKIGWRLGVITTKTSPVRPVDMHTKPRQEDWNGIDAATGLTEEQFENQIDRIERHLDQLVVGRNQRIELHIRFSFEAHLFDF